MWTQTVKDGMRDNPVENIFYASKQKMKNGVYTLQVNNWNRRSDKQGFEVEIEFDGQIHRIEYAKVLRQGETVTVAEIQLGHGEFQIVESLPSTTSVRQVWGVATNTFSKINLMMLSPNHWDEKAVGNKHYFFVLDQCRNDGSPRPFFNEFLKSELDVHRKVFESVSARMKLEDAAEQLSGVGFSSTQRNSLIVKVKGSFQRTVKVLF